ncbi:MAG: lipoyl synthase, partial [Nitrospirae bacterium]
MEANAALGRKPVWAKRRLELRGTAAVRRAVHAAGLHTVCEEARCPNLGECWGRRTATFMLLGEVCTRACGFCGVATGRPAPPDPGEPARVAEAAARLGLRHVVVTSVNRDDLADGGAGHFAEVTRRLHAQGQTVELLVPDFEGSGAAVDRVAGAGPEILGHNLETVERLYPAMRPQADYDRSLALLARVKRRFPEILTKSGLMVGAGERPEEVEAALGHLRDAGCDIVTVGQYLAPSRRHHPVAAYVTPALFDRYRAFAEGLGFLAVAAGPFVRSSYNADRVWHRLA